MKGVRNVADERGAEDRLQARLRELTDATRRVRKDLEDLIRRPHRERSRGLAPEESMANDKSPKADTPKNNQGE